MGYQSSDAAFGSREADGSLLVCPAETAPRSHSATKRSLARGAEAGHFNCCARAARSRPAGIFSGRIQCLGGEGSRPLGCNLGPGCLDDLPPFILLLPLVLSCPPRVGQLPLSSCVPGIPFFGPQLMMSSCPRMPRPPNLRLPFSRRAQKTGIVNLRGETPSPTAPLPIRSDFVSSYVPTGMGEIPSGAGNVHLAKPALTDRTRAPRNYQEGFR